MNTIRISTIILITLTSVSVLQAQTDSTLTKEVQVIKSYQPSISDAYKISANPSIKDTNNYTPTFEYQINSQSISIDKNINHLPVVKLGTAPATSSNTGYLKGGFGNALTPVAELIVNTAPSRNADFGLQLNHFSSRPNILLENGLKVKAPYSESLARIFMKNYFRKSVLDWELGYKRTGLTYYGFPGTDSLDYRANEGISPYLGVRQALHNASAAFTLKNMNSRSSLDYSLNLTYDYLWNNSNQLAHDAGLMGSFLKDYRKYSLLLNTGINFYYQEGINNYFDSAQTMRQFYKLDLAPQYVINRNRIDFKAGLNMEAMFGADSTILWHISPKIYFAYHPIKGILSLFAGTDGGLSPNNYRSAIEQNQYINPELDMKPDNMLLKVYGGFKGKISRKVSYLTEVNYKIIRDQAFYYLYSDESLLPALTNNTFDVLYDDLNLLTFSGNIRYSGTSFSLELNGNYYLPSASTLTQVPYQQEFDAAILSTFKINDRLSFRADATLIGPREALVHTKFINASNAIETQANSNTLAMILDINLGAEYQYTSNLNFFISAQNILNQKTQYWQGYNRQGLLILGGAKFIF